MTAAGACITVGSCGSSKGSKRGLSPLCGIAGWISWDGGTRPASWVRRMGQLLNHRGPDDARERQWDTAGLAFRRLALLDLAGGAQPATDEAGRLWSVFNGEIYNHAELRQRLLALGHRIRGTGDAALIPHLYEEWGEEFVHQLRGMFAIAIYDSRDDRLLLVRDGFGIKPLYWGEPAGALVFGSEVRALRVAGLAGETSPDALSQYLSFGYVPDPMTMWQDVHMLPAGHLLCAHDGRVDVRRWWCPVLAPARAAPQEQVVDQLFDCLEESVSSHLAADVPVGAYLSSGVDSSLLVALAARRQPVRTFSIGFAGSEETLNELTAARKLAAALGTQHHEQVVSAEDYWAALPRIVRSQEEPLADPSAPALWFLAEAASHHVKAVLSGEGADELFGGYPIYREPQALRAVTRLPPRARSGLGLLADHLPDGQRGKGYLRRGSTPLEQRFLGNSAIFDDEAKAALLTPDGPGGTTPSASLVRRYYAGTEGIDAVARMQTVSISTWLPCNILMKADKMAMAHSVEVRVPYLDREVFALARRLPRRLRVGGRRTKVALRAAAEQILPRECAQRPKLGFPVPFRSWLDGRIGADVRGMFGDCADPLLDRAGLLRLLDDGRHPDRHRRVWSVMTYLLWREQQRCA
jgi:asparagine synthase (glutamine-hydrolysing)